MTIAASDQPPGSRRYSLALTILRQPESITAALLLIAFAVGAATSSYFLDARYLLDSTSLTVEVGIMALAMTLVIISGNIDLSVASAQALIGVVAATIYARGVAMSIVIPIALLLGLLMGGLNGILVAKLKLPSLTVTLGTLALYRGLAVRQLGDGSIGHFPDWFVGLDYRRIPGTIIPMPLVIFLALACVFAVVLHQSIFGRCVYAIGANESATRFSGIRVDRVKIAVFGISGLMSAVAALMMLSRLTVAQSNLAMGDELAVITAVVLGGADIFGGRGTIVGTVLALMLLVIVRTAMGVQNVRAENQLAITGSLLIVAVLLGNLMRNVGRKR
jgi:rhamnose transport system permease protein